MKEASYVEIIPTVRRYEWGRRERDALTKVFYRSHFGSTGEVDNDGEPCAELWYGSHVSGPSGVSLDGKLLERMTLDDVVSSDFVIGRGEELADSTRCSGRVGIPFLLKVLSISKPLSLQVHPDKTLARELHSSFPSVYLDDNHKPEIAVALTEFEVLCGFRDTLETLLLLESFPETLPIFGISRESLSQIIGTYCEKDKLQPLRNENNDHTLLHKVKRDLFINMLNSKPETTKDALTSLVTRLTSKQNPPSSSSSSSSSKSRVTVANTVVFLQSLILRLHHHFPLDIGIISPILLNYHKLNPGDAIYIGAGTIHSYISGDCLECMANSDNVVRCGLTPKLKDVPTLIKAVNFQSNNARLILNHAVFSSPALPDDPPSVTDYLVDSVEEYHVQILSLAFSQDEQMPDTKQPVSFTTPASSPYSLLLCLSGNCCLSFAPPHSADKKNGDGTSSVTLLQGKAILVKSKTEIRFQHPSPSQNQVKLALVTLPPPLQPT